MDEHKNEVSNEPVGEPVSEAQVTPEPESRRDFIRRWAGLIVCTLILIACSLLVAEALKRIITVETVYDEAITIDVNDLYGSWRYAELSHKHIATSVSAELLDEHLRGTVLDITQKRFLATGGVEWYVDKPRYVLHALEEPSGSFDDVETMLGEEVLGYYAILSEGGTVQPYRIYFSRDKYWATEFSDENEAGAVILYDIFRIERAD